MTYPGLVISALRGGSGKTILSLGIVAALVARGRRVAAFKKGPDYIDAGWLAIAAGQPCFNLDSFLLDLLTIRHSFVTRSGSGAISVIEGNRGLFDAIETDGTTSTAELAKALGLPVILCLDCTKTTRTLAAVLTGCQAFDPGVTIGGVVLNRVAGARHESIVRRSIEAYCDIPVIGAIPKQRREIFPERHMGLVPTAEHAWAFDAIETVKQLAEAYIDIEAVEAMAGRPIGQSVWADGITDVAEPAMPPDGPTIGVLRDSAFQFYYPENIEALRRAGARIVETSPLSATTLPDVDGIYIGGGFPETHAKALAENGIFRKAFIRQIEDGLPVYAECGGLMYMGRSLAYEDATYPMVGALPIEFGFSRRPQGHGYTIATVDRPNPYYAQGTEIRGHEFHYSRILSWDGHPDQLVFSMTRGNGIVDGRDGAVQHNVLGTYTHVHALGCPEWAAGVVTMAAAHRASRLRTP